MARKNMYIKDEAAAAAKRNRTGAEYGAYAPAPVAPAGAYYAPAPVSPLHSVSLPCRISAIHPHTFPCANSRSQLHCKGWLLLLHAYAEVCSASLNSSFAVHRDILWPPRAYRWASRQQ